MAARLEVPSHRVRDARPRSARGPGWRRGGRRCWARAASRPAAPRWHPGPACRRRRGSGTPGASTGPGCRRPSCRAPFAGAPRSEHERRRERGARAACPGATAFGCAGSSENVWQRDESGKPSAGTTGEALSHAPLGGGAHHVARRVDHVDVHGAVTGQSGRGHGTLERAARSRRGSPGRSSSEARAGSISGRRTSAYGVGEEARPAARPRRRGRRSTARGRRTRASAPRPPGGGSRPSCGRRPRSAAGSRSASACSKSGPLVQGGHFQTVRPA